MFKDILGLEKGNGVSEVCHRVGTIEVDLCHTNGKYNFDKENHYFVYGCH
jgi:hypothetical protein